MENKELLSQVITALNTIEVKGYSNSKTLCNCMEAIEAVIKSLDENKGGETDVIEDKQ